MAASHQQTDSLKIKWRRLWRTDASVHVWAESFGFPFSQRVMEISPHQAAVLMGTFLPRWPSKTSSSLSWFGWFGFFERSC